MTLQKDYPTTAHSSTPLLSLDRILSSAFHFTVKWSPHLESNKARTLLRYLVYRLYDQGRGNLINAQIELAQITIAKRLGMSRQWVGELTQRLEAAGWIEHASPKLPDGTNGSTVWRAGRMLKRLIVMLRKSKQRKSPIQTVAKSTWHFSPFSREKEIQKILAKENEPPSPALLERIPLLKLWMQRGKENEQMAAKPTRCSA